MARMEYDGKTWHVLRTWQDEADARGHLRMCVAEIPDAPESIQVGGKDIPFSVGVYEPGVDAAQMKALDETIREWEKKAAGEAEYTGTWSDCPMCVANTPLREKPGWSNTTCETCLLFRYLEPVGETCIRHPKLARAERNSTSKRSREGAAEFLAALKELRAKLRGTEEPDEVEAEAQKLCDEFYNASGSSFIWEQTAFQEEWRSIVRYVRENYVPKEELLSEFQDEWQKGWNAGFEAERQAAAAKCKACGVEDAAGKPTISPEDLERLAEGYRAYDTGFPYRNDIPWKSCAESYRQMYRDAVLAMLNATVAPQEVDFVVSGKNGENLQAMTENARTCWSCTLRDWPRWSCEQRQAQLINMYPHRRILLDKNGGGK